MPRYMNVKKREIKWFKDFTCLSNKCPNSCCKGWVIPLSDKDCERLRSEKGWIGLCLFVATGGWIRAKLNVDSGRCPFWGPDSLCRLQKKRGHDFLPWTCQSYPRFYRNFGFFEESCLDLSCPGAAALFFQNNGALDVTESEGEPVTQICTTNDDREFFDFLLTRRGKIISDIRKTFAGHDVKECGRYTDRLFENAVMLQDQYTRGETKAPGEPPDPAGNPFSFPLPAEVFRGFLGSSLNHARLGRVSPSLYRMFKRAEGMITRIEKSGSNLTEEAYGFLEANPDILTTLGAYLAYYMFQYYMRIFETYSFRRQVALGLCHMNMILLLVMSEAQEDPVSENMLPTIISVYNRRAYFNDDIQDEMYRIFETARKEHSGIDQNNH